MRLPKLPAEVRYVLPAHRELPVGVEGDLLQLEDVGTPVPDAPVFVFKPLKPEERATWATKVFSDEVQSKAVVYISLVRERLLRVENLTIGDEPFDVEKHLDDLQLEWFISLGLYIMTYSQLTEAQLGKSS